MKVFILAALVAVVASQGYPKPQYTTPAYPAPAYPTPAYKAPAYPAPAYKAPAYPAPAYPSPSYKTPEYAPMPYSFAWNVKDDPSYNDYAHQETADDKGYVTGSYRTLLPDGRTQIVNYKADDYTGYVADVKYEGEAKEYKPAYKPAGYPSPAYPSPAYPSPAYPSPAYPSPAYPSPAYPAPKYPSPAYPAPKYPTKY
ncbi:adhesive plaque matrix protein-like [Daphnia carinata]|uniref:adhesive plaque matrix protein-like n=1 Tax=Daphnia carinata TaxID=120202 RepID=UPI00257B5611|nr:adhesive plaque matrix protein-like [Daphnia carinata]